AGRDESGGQGVRRGAHRPDRRARALRVRRRSRRTAPGFSVQPSRSGRGQRGPEPGRTGGRGRGQPPHASNAPPPAGSGRTCLGPLLPDRPRGNGHRMTNSIDPASLTVPADSLDAELRKAVARVARVPVLLIACDYDGTLAPIVEDPTKAVPLREAVAAVRALASLPQTTVAVISGRALRDLAVLSRLPDEVHLVGSHGSEFDTGFIDALEPQEQQLHTELTETLSALVRRRSGVRLEV